MRDWARAEALRRDDLVQLGYFGSYARGDCGVGSDLDVVAVVDGAPGPWEDRTRNWDCGSLPVPVDMIVHTAPEWRGLLASQSRYARMLRSETVWVYRRSDG